MRSQRRRVSRLVKWAAHVSWSVLGTVFGILFSPVVPSEGVPLDLLDSLAACVNQSNVIIAALCRL